MNVPKGHFTFTQCSGASKVAGARPDARVEGRLCLRTSSSSLCRRIQFAVSAAGIDLVRVVQARPPSQQQQQFLQTPV